MSSIKGKNLPAKLKNRKFVKIKAMMTNILPITVLFIFIFTSTFLVQLGEAVDNGGYNVTSGGHSHHHHFPHHHKQKEGPQALPLSNLTGKDAEFYNEIVEPMVKNCVPVTVMPSLGEKIHGVLEKVKEMVMGVDFAKRQKERLCAHVKMLDKLFIELDGEYQMKADWERRGQHREETEENVDKILGNIHGVILADLSGLHKEYSHLRNMEGEKIVKEVEEIAKEKREHLNTEFVQIFGQLIEENKEEKQGHKREKPPNVDSGNSAAASFAFRLVCIGQQMAAMFNKNLEEKIEWAYQQLVANLVIHSLGIGTFCSGEEGVQELAKDWPIGMIECDLIEKDSAADMGTWLSMHNLTEKDKEFHNLILVPLMPKCAKHIRDEEKQRLCEVVIELNKLFMELNVRYKLATLARNKTQEAALEHKIVNIKFNIRDQIHFHGRRDLLPNYTKEIGNEFAIPIKKEVDALPAPKSVNLKKAFKRTYAEWKTEMEKNKNPQRQTEDKYITNSKYYWIARGDIIIYKLLYIDNEIVKEFKKDTVKEAAVREAALQWAYQEFAVCLRIHSVHLAKHGQKGEFEIELEVIAESWPEIGLQIEEEKTIEPSVAIAGPKDTY